jgi:hypothetical protein
MWVNAEMSHSVDGFELKFTSRTSWKARVWLPGGKAVADDVPVTWKDGWRFEDRKFFQRVWFRKADELEAHKSSRKPFLVAVADRKEKKVSQAPSVFKSFIGVYEVVSTGTILSENSIETRVVRRLKAEDF